MSIKDLFRQPRAEQLAQRELEEARRELLRAQSGLEYAKAMCDYHTARIERLEQYDAA